LERPVVLARALPRDPARGEDQLVLEFEFDAEYGTMLRRAIFDHSKCLRLTEAVEVDFGVDVDPNRFVFVPG
jgi:hypothetical protein